MPRSAAKPLPRYAAIQQSLEQAILSGAWAPGHRVPPEHELMVQFSCSRMTVSRALSALSGAGLIVRRRRSGSFVATRAVEETVLEIHDIPAEIAALGQAYAYELQRIEPRRATPRDAARLGVAEGSPVLALTCSHFADGLAFVLEDRLSSLEAVPAAKTQDFHQQPPGTWLLSHIPWSSAEHQIRAVNADPASAARLGLQSGAACLVVTRRTWQAGLPLTAVDLTYPGERHRLVGQFGPSAKIGGAAR
jgi:GntR family transcriptional regulator, histidine utilization repressor